MRSPFPHQLLTTGNTVDFNDFGNSSRLRMIKNRLHPSHQAIFDSPTPTEISPEHQAFLDEAATSKARVRGELLQRFEALISPSDATKVARAERAMITEASTLKSV